MSYAPGAYVPPPPASAGKRKRSPWLFVGAGCLGMVLLTLGAIGYFTYKLMGVVNAPVDTTKVVASLGKDFPIYPKAKLDLATTKIIVGTTTGLKFFTRMEHISAAAFRVPATPTDAVGWYDVEMSKRGYVPTKSRQPSIGQKMENQVTHQYYKKKEKEMVTIQAGISPDEKKGDAADASILVVMRMTGISHSSASSEPSDRGFVPDLPAKK